MQAPLKRPVYFSGMLLTAEEFQAEQQYHQQKRRLLNRTLHGHGVVCGLLVIPTDPPHPARVVVEPGLALDASGREIVVPEPQELDLAACQRGDEKVQERGQPERLFITLEYDEKETGWLPGYGDGGETRQPSRIEEGFRLSVRATRPVAAAEDPHEELLGAIAEISRDGVSPEALRRLLVQVACRPCPPIPRDGALTLASVDLGPGPVLTEQIDNITHRPVVLSSAAVLHAIRLAGQRGSET